MTAPKAVISDFGGVLTTPLLHSFAAFQDHAGVPIEALGRALQSVAVREGANPLYELEKGHMTEADFLAKIGEALSEELGRPVEMERFSEVYFAQLESNQPMIDYLRSLKDRGVRLAMLTNNVVEWEPRWRAMLPVDEIFELVVDSAFVGMRKPDPEIYELTLERLGLTAQECVFVDDIDVNCDAARALGMTAVHFVSSEQAIAEIETALAGGDAG
jgi:epoxide hydrolase-like predicted phosphatase